jgi:hypothetical protein
MLRASDRIASAMHQVQLEEFLGLLDSTDEHPQSRLRRYIITVVAFCVLVGLELYIVPWNLRFHQEKKTVREFLAAVVSGNMQAAYQIWKPQPSYSFKDFMDDWGPEGYYGPVKSYHYERADRPKGGGTGVIVTFEVNPYDPFPAENDEIKQSKTKEVRVWVEFKDQSMSYPP